MTDGEQDGWLVRLDAEHQRDSGPAMKWLVEHSALARSAIRALVGSQRTDTGTRRAFDVLARIGPDHARLAPGELTR